MVKFIKHYALEIYTVLAMFFLVYAAMMDGLSVVQRFVVLFNFLFILHEWEEGVYPGGFIDLISSLIEKEVTDDLRRASRIPTGILLVSITLVPFIFDKTPMFAVSIATFGIFEGFVHTMGIRLFRLKRKYTPGMATAWIEAVTGIVLLVFLASKHLAAWYDYVGGIVVFFAAFVTMQKSLTMMVGIRYRDMTRLLKKQLQKHG
ncbi:MAG: HXXEE domain-containing protein [Bacteroidales bacterium]|nr:HXXEE domain-containing protein [Bacteroidales bacterium]